MQHSQRKTTKLNLQFCSNRLARYACQNWHYSKRIPVNKLIKIGVWEDGIYKGVIIYGVGASAQIHRQFNLKRTEVCELVRIALRTHETPVSRIISISLKLLKNQCPGIRIIVSFADPTEGHHGGIYQASNWVYTGKSSDTIEYYYNGEWRHETDVYKRLTKQVIKKLYKRKKQGKYRYVLAVDKSLNDYLNKLKKEFPKCGVSLISKTIDSNQ
jgi:hypothetical protein